MIAFLIHAAVLVVGIVIGVFALAVVIVFLIVPAISRPGRPPRNHTPETK